MFVSCFCLICVGSGLRFELITRPADSYRVCVVYHLETVAMRRPRPGLGFWVTKKKILQDIQHSSREFT